MHVVREYTDAELARMERSISTDSMLEEAGAHRTIPEAETPAGPSPMPAGGAGYTAHTHDVEVTVDADSSTSSSHLLKKFAHIPLRVRGRAEAWEVPRDQIRMDVELGRGTGGVVHKAKWRGLECAAKLLSASSQVSVEYHDMINEITVISHLRHPNLVLFLGACTVDEPLLILSEFMAGGSLEEHYNKMRIRLGKPFKPPRQQLYRWMLDLSRAVCFLHSCTNPIMHRDLKPSNLLLSEHEHLKVSDFGLCKTMQKVKEDGTPYSMTGCTGTKRYMAPEVVLSKPDYDHKVDVYSMAMIFWYMTQGERPFEQVEPQLISMLASTRGLRPDVKAIHWTAVEDLVERMWDSDSHLRPECTEILAMLKALEQEAVFSDTAAGSEYHCNVKCQCAVM